MAVSLATRLTSYMGSGDVPRVVISGRFVLGTCAHEGGSRLYVAPYLDMRGLTCPVGMSTLDLCVSGQLDGLPSYEMAGIGGARSNWGPFPDSPVTSSDLDHCEVYSEPDLAKDYPYLVRMSTAGTGTGDTYYADQASPYRFSDWLAAEQTLRNVYPLIGDASGASVVIEFSGRLLSLDLGVIKPAAVFKGPTDAYRVFRTQLFDTGNYAGGWFLDRVDVYDQQQLRGRVTGGGGKVVWH